MILDIDIAKFQSTHPRGVRQDKPGDTPHDRISIHAPTWGATPLFTYFVVNSLHFNPRTHVGCDVGRVKHSYCTLQISIHAPTWGATRGEQACDRLCKISIHAPTWGATREMDGAGDDDQFQSTHPRGVRPLTARCTPGGRNFNPRTHVGCDYKNR